MADVRRVAQREVERNFTTMRTSHKSGMGDLAGTKEGCKVISFILRFCCCRITPVSSAVIADGMELLAESWPHVIPHSRICNSRRVGETTVSPPFPHSLVVRVFPRQGPTNAPGAFEGLDASVP